MNKEDKQYISISFLVPEEFIEDICLSLWKIGVLGIVTDDTLDVAYKNIPNGYNLIKGYFSFADNTQIAPDILLKAIYNGFEKIIGKFGADSISASWHDVSEYNLKTSWKQFHPPRPIGKKFFITPPWRKEQAIDRETIILNPSFAFGTGQHATTRLMVDFLESQQNLQTKSVLDYGTGSGILALIALKMNSNSVIAIDIDSMAIEVAQKNIEFNHLNNLISCVVGNYNSLKPLSFDLILANLQMEILEIAAKPILDLLKINGICTFSGLLLNEAETLIEIIIINGYDIVWKSEINEWAAFAVKKLKE